MVATTFQEKLEQGHMGEHWTLYYTCRNLHYVNLPLSKIVDLKDKGPRIYIPATGGRPNTPEGRPILVPVPDTLCIHRYDWRQKEQPVLPLEFWLEAKYKSRCTFYRINGAWQSGIDARCRNNYLHVEKVTGKPVWIFHLIFPTLERQAILQGAPSEKLPAPDGLYAHPVSLTPAHDPCLHPKMVYWQIERMQRLASVEEVLAASKEVAL